MCEEFIPLRYTPCWVFILEKKKAAGQLMVGYSCTLPDMLAGTHENNLLYYRQFSTLTDGLGHKLLLEELSPRSLNLTIQLFNPEMRDLHEDFIINN